MSGFVLSHAYIAEQVADRLNCVVIFREPGKMAGGLIEEGYGMKGFRVDTKSCTWGPMAGFVCMDPRLTKAENYIPKNRTWTHEALSGEINKNFFGDGVTDPDWVGDVAPIVISQERINYLLQESIIRFQKDSNNHLVGVSKATNGTTVLPWRLIPKGNAGQPWLKDANTDHHVLCVDNTSAERFKQELPNAHGLATPIQPVRFRGFECILGLCNPQTQKRFGFKACVTADYDLFSVWPGLSQGGDRMEVQHAIAGLGIGKNLPGGVARMTSVDTRLKADGRQEHHRYGDVSARIMAVKALLNSGIQNPIGNAVHHNDEAGNLALAKGTLQDCMPLVCFLPGILAKKQMSPSETFLVETLADFKDLAEIAREFDFRIVAKEAWLKEAGLS